VRRNLDRPRCRTRALWLKRLLSVLRFRFNEPRCGDLPLDEPSWTSVREPRRPRPNAPGGAVALELPLDGGDTLAA